ncbi:unnamed protein product (macronuclear) [Paramecium tetraurelia]|uniref:Uncharacterized protein n=1 Tax=Paramecium tetraurelia TaxID=5888 RepID=A0E5I0_PARTE|nr:uncharacterized protein GSPATT00003408001 [Paramecium tetraurelia]CAK90547.1 unnamed protein product [Paramecium tetraurelia]|eukprot:XP_001457944.1 hypothetical protein (macronuclear) [Paramecium tetraurelia strain d4-2]
MQNCDLNSYQIGLSRKQQLGLYSDIEYSSSRYSLSTNNLNLKNLQNLKNRISQLQSVLSCKYRKGSLTRSKLDDSTNLTNDKSTYSLQEHKYNFINFPQQSMKSSDYFVINDIPSQKIQKENKSQSERKNKSILKNKTNNSCSTQKLSQKELLDHNMKNIKIQKQCQTDILQECLKQNLHDRILFLEELKKQKQLKIRQDYKYQKKQIELECQNQIQKQIQNFERQIKNLVESKKNTDSFSQSPLKSQNSPYLAFGTEESVKKFKKEYNEKTHKAIKVRFQNADIVKFKTEYD